MRRWVRARASRAVSAWPLVRPARSSLRDDEVQTGRYRAATDKEQPADQPDGCATRRRDVGRIEVPAHVDPAQHHRGHGNDGADDPQPPPAQIDPPVGCASIAISSATITVTSLDTTSVHPLCAADMITRYVCVPVSTPVLYVF